MPFQNEDQALGEIVQESVENILAFAQKRNATLEVSKLTNARVYVDRQRLNQAITDLLSNAIKFSPARSHVEVFTSQAGTGLGLAIIRELMRRMNGTVGYDSTPGEGATFWLELPVTEPGPREGIMAGLGTDA